MSSSQSALAAEAGENPIDAILAQIAAAQSKDPSGFSSDALTKAILERLNQEVSKVYAEAAGGGAADDGADGDGYADEEEGVSRSPRQRNRSSSPDRQSASSSARRQASVQLPKGPRPVDLWRAAHEIDKAPKEKIQLTASAWDDLVSRLNESSKKKQVYLMKAQHKAMSEQLAGLTFTPQITERSRELAAEVKSLPDRVAALMRKKKARMDAIRREKEERELAEATFKPQLNKARPSTAPSGPLAEGAGAAPGGAAPTRRIGHLMQYEVDRKIRAEQRKALIEEMESRDLTFSPAVNRNSLRIAERLKAQVATQQMMQQEANSSSALAPQGGSTVRPSTAAASRPDARSRNTLPGHEEETFRPRVNPRSKALHRPGLDDMDVHSRLYRITTASTAAMVSKPEAHAAAAAGATASSGGAARSPRGGALGLDGSGVDVTVSGIPRPSTAGAAAPQASTATAAFNVVAYDAVHGKHDFILRRILGSAPPPMAMGPMGGYGGAAGGIDVAAALGH